MAEKIEKKKELDRVKLANLNRLNKTSEMLNSKNNWFYVAIILVNIVTLVVAWLLESNTNSLAKDVFSGFDYRFLYLLVASLVIIVLLKTVPDFVYLYKKTKRRLFGCVIGGNIISSYYGTLTYKSEYRDSIYYENFRASKVNESTSKDIVNSNSISSMIANVCYSLLIVILGSIFVIKSTNILLYILAIIGVLFSFAIVMIVLYFEKYKAKYLIAIGNLCKFLYRIKLVKYYEKLYNSLVVKLMKYGSVFKSNKLYLICKIIGGVLIKFITHLILFFVVCSFGVASWELLMEVLFNCVVMDVVLGMWPMPKGTLLYEIVFLTLYSTIFVGGYVLYGMVVYRFIRYFIIQLVFGVGYVFGLRKRLKDVNEQIQVEIKTISE